MGKLNPNKTRIMTSVKKTTIDEFRAAAKEVGLPRTILSDVVENALQKHSKLFRLAKEKGKSFSLVDMFTMLGEELQERIDEERESNEKSGNAKGAERKVKRK